MRFLTVFVFAMLAVGQAVVAQDRVAKLVELHHLLGNLDDSFYSEYIGLSLEQKTAIDELRKNVDSHVANVMIPRDQIKDPVQFEANWSLATEAVDQINTQLSEVLLPSQLLLYKQREFQSNAQLSNDLKGLLSDVFAKNLSLTEKQKNDLAMIVEKFNSDVSDLNTSTELAIQRIVRQSADNSLGFLKPSQQALYDKKVGRPLH